MTKYSKHYRIIIILFITFFKSLHCQVISDKFGFIQHLIRIEEYKDALYVMDNSNLAENDSLRNTLHYWKGKIHYRLKNLKKANKEWRKIDSSFHKYTESRFFSAYNYAHLGQIGKSKIILQQTPLQTAHLKKLKQYELAGTALLERDLDQYRELRKTCRSSYYPIEKGKKKFNAIYTKILEHQKKNPVIAASLSTLIPGLGKIYAGKTGEGISAFLTVSIFGAMTAESYIKDGIKSPRTIIYGSLFGIFYIGNIWGSIFTAKRSEHEFQKTTNKHIRFHMHIPLRTVFN